MISKAYAIHDSAVKIFLTPMFARTHGEAERNFKAAVNEPQNGHLYSSPENFTLFYIGEYDDQEGKLKPVEPTSIVTAVQCKEASNVAPIRNAQS